MKHRDFKKSRKSWFSYARNPSPSVPPGWYGRENICILHSLDCYKLPFLQQIHWKYVPVFLSIDVYFA